MMIEIFCQKLIVPNVILAVLDHLKPKTSSANHGSGHRAPPLFKISESAPAFYRTINIIGDHKGREAKPQRILLKRSNKRQEKSIF